jgi:CubicO group peptidase (beta-lactamase class C family)
MSRAAQHGLSGTLLVARHDSTLLLRAYGIADRASRTALTVGSPFFLGSIAKTFTAAAILRLEADGKLSVHDSLHKFFPAVRGPIANVTLDQMMSHTAGLPYLPTAGLFGEGSRDSVMREMLAEPLEFEPGTRYAYSSVGFTLLAGVVERVSGERYEQFMERNLFAPAHLGSAGFVGDSLRWRPASTRSYSDNEAEPSLAELPAFPRMVGAGSIVMTVSNLYQWYRSLLAGQILPKVAADKLFSPRTQIRAGASGGYAWTIATVPTGSLRLIAGDIGGFNAEIRDYVDEQFVVAFASNRRTRGRGDREIVMNNVARIVRGTDVPLPPALARPSPTLLQRMEGEYATEDGGHLVVRIMETHCCSVRPTQPELRPFIRRARRPLSLHRNSAPRPAGSSPRSASVEPVSILSSTRVYRRTSGPMSCGECAPSFKIPQALCRNCSVHTSMDPTE